MVNLLINLSNSDLAHPYRNKIAETNVYGILSNLLALTTVKFCIRKFQLCPSPWAIVGRFPTLFIAGVGN